jgi:hypothetical protein
MVVDNTVRDAITEVVRARFVDANITSVKIEPAEDSDGDPVLEILVVFESKSDKDTLDGQKMSGLTRHIMERLAEIKATGAFPLVSFMSTKDAKKLNLAAA